MKLTNKEVVCIISALDTAQDHASEVPEVQDLMDEITEKLCAHYGLSSDVRFEFDWESIASLADE